MTHLKQEPRTVVARLRALALMAAAPVLLAGCETTGSGTPSRRGGQAAGSADDAFARRLGMLDEDREGQPGLDLDKRADIVNKCIDEKMKAASGTAEPAPAAPAPDAKKKKPATAAASEKKQPATPAAGEPDKKPADADAADKKP